MEQLQHQLPGGAVNRELTLVPGNNRLDSVTIGQNVYLYTHDANGNMTRESLSRRLGWDHGDRMKAFATQTEGAEPSVHAQYLYDTAGMRVKKLVCKQGSQYDVPVYMALWDLPLKSPGTLIHPLHIVVWPRNSTIYSIGT
jgi:hypothetical protein